MHRIDHRKDKGNCGDKAPYNACHRHGEPPEIAPRYEQKHSCHRNDDGSRLRCRRQTAMAQHQIEDHHRGAGVSNDRSRCCIPCRNALKIGILDKHNAERPVDRKLHKNTRIAAHRPHAALKPPAPPCKQEEKRTGKEQPHLREFNRDVRRLRVEMLCRRAARRPCRPCEEHEQYSGEMRHYASPCSRFTTATIAPQTSSSCA